MDDILIDRKNLCRKGHISFESGEALNQQDYNINGWRETQFNICTDK